MRLAWDARCKEVHSKDNAQRRLTEIVGKVKALYELKRLMLTADWPMLERPSLAERLKQLTKQLEHWYESNYRMIYYCVQEQKSCKKKGFKDIQMFFPARKRTQDTPTNNDDSESSDDESIADSIIANENNKENNKEEYNIATMTTRQCAHQSITEADDDSTTITDINKAANSNSSSTHTDSKGEPEPYSDQDSGSNNGDSSYNPSDTSSTKQKPQQGRENPIPRHK